MTFLKGIVLVLMLMAVFSCKKEGGLYFLRVIPPADTSIKNLQVFDADGAVTVDGKFYQVNENLEIKYSVYHVISSQIKDWTDELIYPEFSYTNLNINEYLGEFEKREEDVYYTLTVGYECVKDEDPIRNAYTGYYFYSYDYYDRSVWTTSLTEEGL